VSGLLQRANGPPSVQALSADHLHTPCYPRPTPSRTLSTPCVPVFDAGTQELKPLGMTGCPASQWTEAGPLGLARARRSPPGGGDGRPQGMRNPFTFLDQNSHLNSPRPHSHFWAKIITHHPPPFRPLPPTTHTWLIEVNRGCAKVSMGVWLLVFRSRRQPSKTYRGLWVPMDSYSYIHKT